MLSVSYAGKNAYSAGKTTGVLRGSAFGADRGYVLAHCGGGEAGEYKKFAISNIIFQVKQQRTYQGTLGTQGLTTIYGQRPTFVLQWNLHST